MHSSSIELNNCIDLSAFDDSKSWQELVLNKNDNNNQKSPLTSTTVFALLRTWNTHVRANFAPIILSALNNGMNVDEYDLSTGMTLLHFACKFGAKKLGYEDESVRIVNNLIEKGANLSAQCLWVQMTCLHVCAFFDSPTVCSLLLKQPKVVSIVDLPCASFHNSTALHLACGALSLSTAQLLIQAGANRQALDDQQRIPADCIPRTNDDENQQIANTLRVLLLDSDSSQTFNDQSHRLDSTPKNDEEQIMTQFQIGERVRLTNNKTGVIKYFGSVPFGVNLWYGVELDEPTGKHDGCVGGVRYFTCQPDRGIFVQPSSVRKLSALHSPERERRFRPINFPMPDTTSVSSRVDTGLKRDSSIEEYSTEQFHVNDRVALSKNRRGTVKYVGTTPLGPGLWYGIELDRPDGLHDGCLSVDGHRYFQCQPQHGVFVRHHNLKKVNGGDRRTHSLSNSLDRQSKHNSRMTTSDYDATMMSSSILEDDPFTLSTETGIESVTFNLGQNVYYNNHLATVRYIGTALFAEGIWIGIEFVSRSLGKNDGSVNGHEYFQCKHNHGLFVRPNRLTLTKK